MLRTGVCVEWSSRLRHSVTSEGYQILMQIVSHVIIVVYFVRVPNSNS